MRVEDFEPRGCPSAAAARVSGGVVPGNIEASKNTYTVFEVPYYNYNIIYPKTLF